MGAGGEFEIVFDEDHCLDDEEFLFNYEVTCENGATASSTVSITIELPPPPVAADDSGVGFLGTPVVGSVIGNDTPCDPSCETTYELVTAPLMGTVSLGENGSYVYVSSITTVTPNQDEFTYEIYCCGVATGVIATVTIAILDAAPADDFDVVPSDPDGSNPPITGLNAVDDENTSTCDSVRYEWVFPEAANAGTYTGPVATAFGDIDGTPDNFSYDPDAGFCGVGYIQYKTFCTVGGSETDIGDATHTLHTSCATPVDNNSTGAEDQPFVGNVGNNDFNCINGGITSYELVNVSVADVLCTDAEGGQVVLTAFDTATGDYTLTPSGGFGNPNSNPSTTNCCSFDYNIVCTTPNGVFTSQSATVKHCIYYPEARITAGPINGDGESELTLSLIKETDGTAAGCGELATLKVYELNCCDGEVDVIGSQIGELTSLTCSSAWTDTQGDFSNYLTGTVSNGGTVVFNKKTWAETNGYTGVDATCLRFEVFLGGTGSVSCPVISSNPDNTADVGQVIALAMDNQNVFANQTGISGGVRFYNDSFQVNPLGFAFGGIVEVSASIDGLVNQCGNYVFPFYNPDFVLTEIEFADGTTVTTSIPVGPNQGGPRFDIPDVFDPIIASGEINYLDAYGLSIGNFGLVNCDHLIATARVILLDCKSKIPKYARYELPNGAYVIYHMNRAQVLDF